MQISSSNSYNPYLYTNNSSKNSEVTTKGLDENEEIAGVNEEENNTKISQNSKSAEDLTPEEEQEVTELKARDTEVRAHEAAHLAVAGSLAVGGASFTYQKGPDGIQYAIGGEVPIDTSEGATPEETIIRARQIKAAATAPAEPSGADMKIASTAAIMEMKAVAELAAQKQEENQEQNNPYATSNEDETSPLDLIA